MKIFPRIINNKNGQAMVEYVLFILVMFIASYGMIKLFILVWQHKFELVYFIVGVSNVLF
jgi:hypothetical protein